MSWIKDKDGKLTIWVADNKGNPNVIGDNITPPPSFNAGTVGTGTGANTGLDGVYTVDVGFGLTDESGKPLALAPIQIKPYIVALAGKKGKESAAYQRVAAAVGALSGAKRLDPNYVAGYVSKIAQNLMSSGDVISKSGTLEDYFRNAVSQGLGGSGNRQPIAYVSSKSVAANTIQNVFNSSLKRNATDAEIAYWTPKLIAAEKANPSKYTQGKGGVLEYQKPIDSAQWVLEQLQKTPEYKSSLAAKETEGIAALQATAMANGLDLEANFAAQLPEWKKAIANGADIKTYQTMIRNAARTHLPDSVKSNIDPTLDLNNFYATYINSYAKTFGLNPNQVKISDIEPLALDPAKGSLVPIYQFDKAKRSLPQWQYTPEAKASVSEAVTQVLKDFGFMG